MVGVAGRLWQRYGRLHFACCAVAACCLALAVLLRFGGYRSSVTVVSDSSRARFTPQKSSVTLPVVSVIPTTTSSWNYSASVTGLDDIFISIKTTGKNHNTRIKLQQTTWLTLAQKQVGSIYVP